jgi:hypothetical protein
MCAMPLDLTDLEPETAARACRALAYQEEQAAKRMEIPVCQNVTLVLGLHNAFIGRGDRI